MPDALQTKCQSYLRLFQSKNSRVCPGNAPPPRNFYYVGTAFSALGSPCNSLTIKMLHSGHLYRTFSVRFSDHPTDDQLPCFGSQVLKRGKVAPTERLLYFGV